MTCVHMKTKFWQLLPAALLILSAALPLEAQQRTTDRAQRDTTEQMQQDRLTPAQRAILQRIQQSGLSREQVRQRLRMAGYDPELADRYFDEMARPDTAATASRLSRVTRPLPQPDGNLVNALRRIGILAQNDSLPGPDTLRLDTARLRARREAERSSEPQIFGRELFAATTQFEPVIMGPVDPDYRLGPGDELTLIVTGDVESAYELQVTREGYIVIPDVGQVLVNGLTLDQLKGRLNDRLARVYSGVQVGTTQFDLTVGKLRSKLVYVIGEVELPGAYQIAGTGTVFSALYRAGGPARNGSFRSIEVRRNNRLVQRVDLYDYLLRGDKGGDIRLEQGDVVFVPIVGPQVTVVGSVRRPAIYELKATESLSDVMMFAGGVEAAAAIERVQVDRILPPGQRQPGRERVLVDVALSELRGPRRIPMMDGDRVRVSAISDVRRNRVAVTGDIQRPGEYEYRRGMTALGLIEAAQGLLPSAYTPVAHIVRTDPADSTTSLVRVSLDDPAAADYAGRVPLEDLDELIVFGRAQLAAPQFVEIFGHVKNPGTYPYSRGVTVQDLVLLAGGFVDDDASARAEVARKINEGTLSDTLASVYTVTLPMAKGEPAVNAAPFPLQQGDQVFIRRLPGTDPLSTVEIVGEIVYPGRYTLGSRQERVSDVVRRAGGLAPDAYAAGFRLFRNGNPVGVDLPRALSRPGSPDDMLIEPGDRMEIPRYDPTVLVTGAVQFESRVRWEKGLSVDDYLARAGGVREDGNEKRVSVRYPNGELRTPRRTLFVKTYPRVQPGSTITVPVRSEQAGTDWDRILTRSMTLLSTLATVVLTVRAVN